MNRFITIVLAGLMLLSAVPATALAALPDETATERPASSDTVALSDEARRLVRGDSITDVQIALEKFWSPERMREARPALEQPEVVKRAQTFHDELGRQLQDPRSGRDEIPDGPPETVKPASPEDAELSRVDSLATLSRFDSLATPPVQPTDSKTTAASLSLKTTASVFASTTPNYSSTHPVARTNGKVFFTNANDGLGYACSASVVNSAGKDTVWTAGHCVHGGDGGTWHQNWIFVPAFKDGVRPYGTWFAKQLWTMNSWIGDSDFTSDIGVAVMHPRSGQHIVSTFGGHGISWNYSKSQYVRAFGYPSEAPFSGQRLVTCYDQMWPEWSFLWISSDTVQIVCDMTRGSSGGPWLRSFNGSYGYLNGVNSRINRIVGPTRMYSPYFDNSARNLYNATKNL